MSSWTRVSLKERICSASQMGGSMLRAPGPRPPEPPPPGTLPRGGGATGHGSWVMGHGFGPI